VRVLTPSPVPLTNDDDRAPHERPDRYDRALADFCRMNCAKARVRFGARTHSAIVARLVKAATRFDRRIHVRVRGDAVFLSRDDRSASR